MKLRPFVIPTLLVFASTIPLLARAADAAKPIATLNDPAFQQWMKIVAALPDEKQFDAVVKKLQELNPGFDGQLGHNDRNWWVQIICDHVSDISPLRAFAGLKILDCAGSGPGKGKLSDLSPIQGLNLTKLRCCNTQVADLSPLKGMQIQTLQCNCTQVADLSPLRGMKLMSLHCNSTQVADLTPLNGMPLTQLFCNDTQISDLSPLRGLPLTLLHCGSTKVSDLAPLKHMQLTILYCPGATQVSDLSALIGMSTLDFLNVERTKVTAAGIAALKNSRSNCSIQWDAPPQIHAK